MAGFAPAATFVVDVNYDGISSATACEQPAGAAFFTTFAAAFGATATTTVPPHNVRVCPGAYNTSTPVIASANQIGMTVQGTTGIAGSVIVNGGLLDVFDVRQADITFEALTINGGRFSFETTAAGSALTLNNIVINDSLSDSIRVLSPNPTLTDLFINNAGQDGIELLAAATNARLENITVAAASEDCLQLDGDDAQVNRVRVDGCRDIGLETRGDRLQVSQVQGRNIGDRGLFISGADGVFDEIEMDTVAVDGIQGSATADNATLTNITVRNADDECIQWQGDGLSATGLSVDTCGDHGVQVIPTGGGTNITLNSVDIQNTTDDGLLIQNVASSTIRDVRVFTTADRGVTLNNISGSDFSGIDVSNTANDGIRTSNLDNSTFDGINLGLAGDNGLEMANGSDNNTFSNISSTGSTRDGMSLNNSSDNSFTDSEFTNNGDDGISLIARSDGNVLENLTVNSNADEGVTLNNVRNVAIRNSIIDGNANDGIQLTNNSIDNTFEGNLVENNGSEGAIIFNTNLNTGNTFSNNCFAQASVNVQDNETNPAGNAFNNGSLGNYYGSIPAGSGFSDTCTDADSNNICDAPFSVPGGAGAVDNIALVTCGALTSAGLTVSKSVSTLNDPVNAATNPKAIPGATLRYTITVANSPAAGTQLAERTLITDDLDNEITTLQHLRWVASSMTIMTPAVNGGVSTALSDAADSDAGEFDDSAGGRTVTARCGDLAAGESCVLTFEVVVQ